MTGTRKKKKQEIIYLEIAGFIIKISFGKFINEANKDNVIEGINLAYYGFFPATEPKKINYELIFIDDARQLYLKKAKRLYLFFYENITKDRIVVYSQIGWIHFSIILREILSHLLEGRGLMLHGSASEFGAKAMIFMGKSGAGKSTVTQLLSPGHRVLADDSIIIKKEGSRYYFYQSPFVEKNKFLRIKKRYEIGGIFFLKKASYCEIEKIDKGTLITRQFITQIFSDTGNLNKNLKFSLTFFSQFENLFVLKFSKKAGGLAKIIREFFPL